MSRTPTVSFEFFPPKTEAAEQSLWKTIERLAPLNPAFVSVTYGAGGTTRERTSRLVVDIHAKLGLTVAAHLTCVGASRAETDALVRTWQAGGIRHVVALRGDPPAGADRFTPHPEGYVNAADLVAGLKRLDPTLEQSVGAYPEIHPDSPSEQADLDNLKAKQDAGADRAITQFFFDVDVFLRFRDKAVAHGITLPLVPGILPVTNLPRVVDFAGRCGATVPDWLKARFDGLDGDAETTALIGGSVAIEQCQRLAAEGADHIHFYTLNRPQLTYAICHQLGLRAKDVPAAA